MQRSKSMAAMLAAACAVALPGTGHADEAFENAVRKCRAIDNPDARLTCYDAVASVAPEPAEYPVAAAAAVPAVAAATVDAPEATAASAAPEAAANTAAAATAAAIVVPSEEVADDAVAAAAPEPAAAAGSNVQPLTDEVGLERVDPGRQENPEYSARVIRCDNNPQSGQTYFFFDNDQVWKQANYRRMSFGDCDFDVRLSKDAFGYELYIPSKDRTVRVTRIR